VEHRLEVAAEGVVEQAEVDAGEEHEDDDDPVDGQGVVGGDAGVFHREAAGGDGGHGMSDGVIEAHARHHEEDDL
jgi:hypothetical protein